MVRLLIDLLVAANALAGIAGYVVHARRKVRRQEDRERVEGILEENARLDQLIEHDRERKHPWP